MHMELWEWEKNIQREERPKWRKLKENVMVVLLGRVKRWQRRLGFGKALTQRHAHVHAELAPDAFKLLSTPRYQRFYTPLSPAPRNLRNRSTEGLRRRKTDEALAPAGGHLS